MEALEISLMVTLLVFMLLTFIIFYKVSINTTQKFNFLEAFVATNKKPEAAAKKIEE
jgi:hypothetical protein